MSNERLALILGFTFSLATVAVFSLRPRAPVGQDDHVAIYRAVIQDLRGPGALIDPKILEPIDEQVDSPAAWSKYHGRATLDALIAGGVVAGLCEPAEFGGHEGCRGDSVGTVVALSAVRHATSSTVKVSILLYTVPTRHDKFYLPFAVEQEYELEKEPAGWTVTSKRRTMIT